MTLTLGEMFALLMVIVALPPIVLTEIFESKMNEFTNRREANELGSN